MVTVGKRFGQKEAPYPADDAFARRYLGQPRPVVELNGPDHRNFDTRYFFTSAARGIELPVPRYRCSLIH